MTSDLGETFNTLKAGIRALRRKLGVECPQCCIKQPERIPTILLPGQRCKVDGYRDPRPYTTREERNAIYAEAGIDLKEIAR